MELRAEVSVHLRGGAEVMSRGRLTGPSSDLGPEKRNRGISWFELLNSERVSSEVSLCKMKSFISFLLARSFWHLSYSKSSRCKALENHMLESRQSSI